MDAALLECLRRNVDEVRARIDAARRRAGRGDDVSLVAVTKTASLDEARGLAQLGLRDFGENRAHEGEAKRSALPAGLRWHMIGRLQTNKARRALAWADVLHALDRPSLAAELEKFLVRDNRVLPVYVQVNASGEEQKAGVRPEDAPGWVDELRRSCPHLALQGLMTMAPYDAPAEVVRPLFRRLRELAAKCAVPGLSMGMSGDFETAVEEGATVIRVGSALLKRQARR